LKLMLTAKASQQHLYAEYVARAWVTFTPRGDHNSLQFEAMAEYVATMSMGHFTWSDHSSSAT